VLEFKGENMFKVNAYRKAARTISELDDDIAIIAKQGRLQDIPGIGEGIAKKIEEYIDTGHMKKYDEITRDVSKDLIQLMSIQGLGAKTLKLIHTHFGVNTLEDLKNVINTQEILSLPGMGKKKIENIKRGIELFQKRKGRLPLGIALPLVEEVVELLKKDVKVYDIRPAGSLRRMRETIGDIDIIVSSDAGPEVIDKFINLPVVKKVLVAGETKASIIVREGIQIDLRVVNRESYGAALQYFTGSKAHNIQLRAIAKKEGLKINEYGIFRIDNKGIEKKIGGSNEEEVYKILGMCYIPPELREDRGEIEAALKNTLPKLVEYTQIRGDLHVHSNYSDGSASIEEIVEMGMQIGYKYIAVCDHSQSVRYANGLRINELIAKQDEIEKLNHRMQEMTILTGTEVDILADGSLDYPDEILKKLDIVIAAIHSGFKHNVTYRLCKAMENPYVDIIAHPTGRLISKREGYEVDLDKVIEKAAKTKTAIEINAYYDRLDIPDIYCQKAKKLGVKFIIGTDAHHLNQMWMMKLGVGVARRGWLEQEDIINTYDIHEVTKMITRKRDIG
jgi:DNA polymerase (family 10)